MRPQLALLTVLLSCGLASAQIIEPDPAPTPADSWTVSGKLLYLHRNSPDARPLINANNANVTLFESSQYDFGLAPGVDFSLAHRIGDSADVQLRYFALYDASAHEQFTLGVFSQTAGQPNTLFTAPANFDTKYRTDINSVEANLGVAAGRRLHAQAGFRWLNLTEKLESTIFEPGVTFPPPVTTHQHVGARNNLYGFQGGCDGVLWDSGRRSQITAFGKAGVYYNDAEVQFSSLDSRNFGASAVASEQAVAFVGELGLDWNFAISERVSFILGGQLMYLAGVALASDQPSGIAPLSLGDIVLTHSATLTPNMHGDVLLYGLRAGITFRW